MQYFAVRYTERFVEAGAVGSVGSRSDCDNALAEAFNSLCKAVLVRNQAPSRSIGELELAVAEYINWYNHRHLRGEISLLPPREYETARNAPPPAQHPAPRDINPELDASWLLYGREGRVRARVPS